MVLCFQCSRETKTQLDELVESGAFADLSEAIAVSVGNQVLLHKSAGGAGMVLQQRSEEPGLAVGASSSRGDSASKPPAIFQLPIAAALEPVAAPGDSSMGAAGEMISQADWVFGQHNKLLPVKASCRAIANLLLNAPNGLEAEEVSRVVAGYATELGAFLSQLDEKYERTRDEMLAVAFPGRADPDKGRIRYANQFVVGVTKAGGITGLLVDLGLINKLDPSSTRVALTEAGWTFALLPNPVLDENSGNPERKLSLDERNFLLEHIAKNVATEREAFRQILGAIHDGHDNPEKLRGAFSKIEKETPKNQLYFSTQRSGALSRLADLGLLRRERNGTRVRYAITDDGAAFLNR
jgi:Arc/MetJ-type ribon-helix-helix transcriptional regulator